MLCAVGSKDSSGSCFSLAKSTSSAYSHSGGKLGCAAMMYSPVLHVMQQLGSKSTGDNESPWGDSREVSNHADCVPLIVTVRCVLANRTLYNQTMVIIITSAMCKTSAFPCLVLSNACYMSMPILWKSHWRHCTVTISIRYAQTKPAQL